MIMTAELKLEMVKGNRGMVFKKGHNTLKPLGTKALQVLLNNPDRFIPISEIIKGMWGEDHKVDKYSINTVRVHMIEVRDFVECLGDFEVLSVIGTRNRNTSRGYLLKTI